MHLLPDQLAGFPKRARKRHLDTEGIKFGGLGVLLFLVLGVSGVAQLGYLSGTLGVYGDRRGRDQVRRVHGVQGAVQRVEGFEFGFEGTGLHTGETGAWGEGDGFTLGVHCEGEVGVGVEVFGHFEGFGGFVAVARGLV